MHWLKKTGILLLVFTQGVLAEPLIDQIKALGSSDAAVRAAALTEITESGDQRMIQILSDYRTGNLYRWDSKLVLGLETSYDNDYNQLLAVGDLMTHEPLLDEAGNPVLVLLGDTECIEPNRKERKLVLVSIMMLELSAPDTEQRLEAVRKAGLASHEPELTRKLAQVAESDPKRSIRRAAKESAAMLDLRSGDPELEAAAIEMLGRLRSVRARSFLEELDNVDTPAVQNALGRIITKERQIATFNVINSGVSSGSVLVLMALGLAVTFGMMGVINMAHGEMMMIGAYTTYSMQLLFGHTPETPHNFYYILALPMAFLVSAFFGGLIEWTVVRRLYKRPLESLLATYGVGLILIQTIRLIFGDNRPSNSPTWLQGGVELVEGMSLSFNRIFIFFLCAVAVLGVVSLMRFTSLGLKMRAVIQNRDMAAAMGINTRRTDSFTFMLGSGLAGVAGCALTTIGGITPDMGQNYIVDSFLVVVTGGVGNLAGVVCSGMGLGLLNKILEGTFFGAVWSKIIVLITVIAFIQYKPSGLFAPKGRLADD